MGCLARLGCLTLLVIVAAVAWLTRDTWMSKLRRGAAVETTAVRADGGWQPVTAEGARRAREQLRRLEARNGPAYVHLTAADLVSHVLQELTRTLPASTDSIEAAAIGDRLHLRARIATADLGRDVLGPMAGLFGDRERVQLGGVLRIIRPGFGELQVKEFRIRDLSVPGALIPRLIRQITRGERPPELSPDGLPLQTPPYIGDVRVSDGRITLYRAH